LWLLKKINNNKEIKMNIWISEDKLKDESIINENVDMKMLESTIADVQRMYIEPILGTKLFNKIDGDIPTLTGNYETLMDDYIQPAMIRWIMFEVPTILSYRFMNKGVMKKNSDNSQPVDLTEMKRIQEQMKDKAQYYSQLVTNYLRANTDLFPEYLESGEFDDIRPTGNNYSTGMYLGGNEFDCGSKGLEKGHSKFDN